jgi:hypothetical protein
MKLTVKPVLCIADRARPACDMSLRVLWRSESSGDYCLSTDIDANALHCWNRAPAGEWRERRSVNRSFQYRMIGSATGPILATATVEVLRVDSDDRRRERRTRHVWDVL